MKALHWLWIAFLGFGISVSGQVRVERHHGGDHHGHHRGKRVEKRAEILTAYLTEQLSLNSEQQTQVREVLLTHGKKIAELRKKAKQEGRRPPVDEIRSLKQAEDEAIRAILDEEQQEIFASLGTDWRKKAFQWWKEQKKGDEDDEVVTEEYLEGEGD